MATISWNATSTSDLDKVWRIVQLQLAEAFNFVTEEWDILSNKVPRLRINLSARQMILPLDIQEDYGVASIPENGWEAVPVSPNVVDSEFTWITLHKRFALSRTARHLDKGGNSAAMVMKQIRYQGMKAVQALKRRIGDYFYGYGTAYVCKVSAIGSDILTPKDLYTVSGLGTVVDWVRIFKVGDRVGVLNPSGPALRGTAAITAINASTGALTLASTPGSTAADDLVVFANSVEDNTLAQTDYNGGLTGLLDANLSTSLQSVSGTTYPNWTSGYTDSASGRFGTIELRKGRQGVKNKGGGDLDVLLMDQGVENDIVAGLRGGLRFSSAFNMEIDGSPSAKGVTIMSTQRVPDGYVFGWVKANSIAKIQLLEGLDTPGWDEAEKVPNRASFVFPMDWPCQMVYKNRGNLAIWYNKTAQ